MTNDSLRRETVDRLSQNVASEAYHDALTALAEYRRLVDAAVADWPPDGPPPAELAEEANELMGWVLQMARSGRSQTSHAFDQVSTVLHYTWRDRQVPGWKTEG
jgi:hypothetical protein